MKLFNWLLRVHHFLLPYDGRDGWVPYLWLIYLLAFLVPVGYSEPWTTFLVALAGSFVFLALYFRAHWVKGRALWPYIAGIALIGVAMLPIHGSALTFFIYAGSFAGFAGRPKTSLIILGILVVLQASLYFWFRLPTIVWVAGIVFTLLIGAVNIYYAELERKNTALKLSREETSQMARFAERERIARDLHDLLGHTLSVIALKADLAAKLVHRDADQAATEIDDVRRITRETLQQVREAVSGYRAHGLAAELAGARLALEAGDIHFEYDSPPRNGPPVVEAALALIVREAVTNTLRHAKATKLRVHFSWDGNRLETVIADNGVGGSEREGSGIKGMRDRVDSIGGTLTITRGGGRTLRVSVPLDQPPGLTAASGEEAGDVHDLGEAAADGSPA